MIKFKKFLPTKMSLLVCFVAISNLTFCSTTMPWDGPLEKIQQSISGPVAKGISIITIVTAGLTWAFSDGGGMTGKAIKIVCGVAIAVGGASLLGTLFKSDGGGFLF